MFSKIIGGFVLRLIWFLFPVIEDQQNVIKEGLSMPKRSPNKHMCEKPLWIVYDIFLDDILNSRGKWAPFIGISSSIWPERSLCAMLSL